MRFTSLMLASAASMMALSSAVAADAIAPHPVDVAPTPVAAPAPEAVSMCDVAGTGFFLLPGTETCLKIGGRIDVFGGNARLSVFDDVTYGGVRASVDLDTHTDSEIGAIGSKFRATLINNFDGSLDNVGVELAYITVGPAYAGYKETLFDTRFGYGPLVDGTSTDGLTNTLTAGVLYDAESYYVGFGIEATDRHMFANNFDSADNFDLVARGGIEQAWGSSDLSGYWSDENDVWAIKSTTDFHVLPTTDLRLVAGYADIQDTGIYLASANAKHNINESVAAYGGVGYVKSEDDVIPNNITMVNNTLVPVYTDDVWLANAGVLYTPIEGLDVTGEVGYFDAGGELDGYNGLVKFTRSW